MRYPLTASLLLAVVVSTPRSAMADEPRRPPSPDFHLPAPEPTPILDLRSDPPDDRVGTYPDPQLHTPWLGPAIGVDARVTGDTGLALAAEGIAALPFQIWRGGFDPGFFPTLRVSSRGTSALDVSAGFGLGVFEDRGRYRDEGWKTLSYTPQIAWRVAGAGATSRGFRHDLVFKPGLLHLGLAHVLWPGDAAAMHELRLVIGASVLEGML